jgi:hypothetical protein
MRHKSVLKSSKPNAKWCAVVELAYNWTNARLFDDAKLLLEEICLLAMDRRGNRAEYLEGPMLTIKSNSKRLVLAKLCPCLSQDSRGRVLIRVQVLRSLPKAISIPQALRIPCGLHKCLRLPQLGPTPLLHTSPLARSKPLCVCFATVRTAGVHSFDGSLLLTI